MQVRDNESIKGINTYEIQLSAYADDAYFFALEALSPGLILQSCATFQSFPSLKFHVEKCEACWIGAEKDNPAKPITITTVSGLTLQVKLSVPWVFLIAMIRISLRT